MYRKVKQQVVRTFDTRRGDALGALDPAAGDLPDRFSEPVVAIDGVGIDWWARIDLLSQTLQMELAQPVILIDPWVPGREAVIRQHDGALGTLTDLGGVYLATPAPGPQVLRRALEVREAGGGYASGPSLIGTATGTDVASALRLDYSRAFDALSVAIAVFPILVGALCFDEQHHSTLIVKVVPGNEGAVAQLLAQVGG
jgi:hypothetical protein